jgi:hypothetical protein
VRVGDHDRTFDEAGLLDPGRAGHLAVAVERVPAAEHRGIQLAARQDGGHAGAHRTLAHLEPACAGDQGGEADRHPGDIGNGIERPGLTVERDAQMARAGSLSARRFRRRALHRHTTMAGISFIAAARVPALISPPAPDRRRQSCAAYVGESKLPLTDPRGIEIRPVRATL